MDGRGRVWDNIFLERLWRTVKYEEVYLKSYKTVREAKAGLAAYFHFCNKERLMSPSDTGPQRRYTSGCSANQYRCRLTQSTLKKPVFVLTMGKGSYLLSSPLASWIKLYAFNCILG